jgi:hypothetical protein
MPAGPRLRRDFVGMMYAVTIGEVGLQAAALVKVGHPWHFLPAYSHLVLATVVIATSFVGWSVSLEWAQRGVPKVFHPEFLVLLLDVSLVILYFILVRSVEFVGEGRSPSIAPAERVACWIVVMFVLYLVWDVLTSIAFKKSISLRRSFWEFVAPTVSCFVLALLARNLVKGADCSHLVTSDLALLSLVLLFRALKDLGAAIYQALPKAPRITLRTAASTLLRIANHCDTEESAEDQPEGHFSPAACHCVWRRSVVCGVLFVLLMLGLLWTACPWQLPSRMVTAIEYPSPPCIEPGVEPGSPR